MEVGHLAKDLIVVLFRELEITSEEGTAAYKKNAI